MDISKFKAQHTVLLIAMLLISVVPAWSETLELTVLVRTEEIQKPTDIGSINIPSLGKVRFIAQREGAQVLIHATGPDGAMLGRAEATVGLSSTPIHITTPSGLKKIEIIWASPPDS
jgi:hypothetical protein